MTAPAVVLDVGSHTFKSCLAGDDAARKVGYTPSIRVSLQCLLVLQQR